jgi:hypothetical protein
MGVHQHHHHQQQQQQDHQNAVWMSLSIRLQCPLLYLQQAQTFVEAIDASCCPF